MSLYYTEEKQTQIIISLLKKNGIRKIIASPGTTNMAFIGSIQKDEFFEIFSSVDERSAAYIACGLAAESGEPVVLSCTGATASRNYFPGLTEAYYRKLPVLAITSMQTFSKIGHLVPQVLDRSVQPKDAFKFCVELPIVKDDNDLWDCEIKVNKAILELSRNGGGPVHINLPTTYSKNYNIKELPNYKAIRRYQYFDQLPDIPKGRIGIFVGSHTVFTEELTHAIDSFCLSNNGVVFCDHTSNYYGRYKLQFSLVSGQIQLDLDEFRPEILIHIGEISGDYYNLRISGREVWRVSEDGEIRDTFRKLTNVFQLKEIDFFNFYNHSKRFENTYYEKCSLKLKELQSRIPELPFSNIWIASQLSNKIPSNSTIHFGILNSLRSWNFFELPDRVTSACNVGGFGIDGGMSSFIGSSLANKDRLHFLIIGDLAFFYDMNVLGNRHLGKNIRILVVNNGKGTEFRQYNHVASQFDQEADKYIAAAGHFGNKSPELIKNYALALGFNYVTSSGKDDFLNEYEKFLHSEEGKSPILFEVFTDSDLESKALELILNIEENVKGKAKDMAKQILGKGGLSIIKKVMNK